MVSFKIPQDDKIKWELYSLYRTQKNHYLKTKQWLTSIESINPSEIKIDDKIIQPSIENHKIGSNIMVKSPFSNKILTIKEGVNSFQNKLNMKTLNRASILLLLLVFIGCNQKTKH
ncbi:hypothetical protein [Polaribacter atrinae]|uniref:hypothetical protein n=1 Tax=Polaribacter atrinae TaxID=1333662 RepID=UPI0030F956AF